MSLIQTNLEIEYPETDGKPMGETDLHRWWMNWICDVLSYRYRDQRVYVSCNLLLYYSEGNPHDFVVPDDFVVLDCDPGARRVYKLWEEDKAPNVVFEVTSRSTRRDDQVYKPQVYAKIGVNELFLYDPTSEYLTPPLQGFHLTAEGPVPVEPDESGILESAQLGIKLRLEGRDLVMYDSQSGRRLLKAEEAAEEQAKAAGEQAKAAGEQAKAAEEQAKTAEEQAKAAEEQAKTAEEQAKAAEEQAKAAGEQAKVAEARAEAAEERAEAERSAREKVEEELRRLRDQLRQRDS